MIYSEENKIGEISINKAMLQEIITEAIKPWVYTGKLRVISNKNYKLTDKGIFISLHLSVAMGESTKEILEGISRSIAVAIQNSLEMQIDDIEIFIDTMFTKKGASVKREIQFNYNAKQE